MPKLSEATKPRDKSKMVRVDPPAMRPFLLPPPPPPGEQGNVGFIAPTPSQFATDADLRAQRVSKGGTWIPLFPAPPQAHIATGATAASQAKVATKQVPQVKTGTSSTGAATIAVTPAASPSNPAPLPGPAIPIAKNQDQLPDGLTFGRVANTALTANQVDPSKSGFLSKGVRPFSIAPQLAFVAGNGTVTFYYDGTNGSLPLHLFRDDGTIVDLHGSTAVTGLTTGQTYYFYPAFDEATGTIVWATDLPANNFIGAQLGMTSSTSGQIVQTANSFSTSALSFSVELLFNKNSLPGAVGRFWSLNGTQNGNNASGFAGFASELLLNSNGTVSFEISTGAALTAVTSTVSIADGQTHHILATYNGSTLTLYVDGVSQGTATATITGITAFVVIGDRSTAVGDAQCEYLLSRCAFYKSVVLNASQVANHYNLFVNFPVAAYDSQISTDGATNYWQLTETSGTTAADSIGTDTGTYENSPSLNQSLPSIQFFGSPAIAHGRPSYLGLQYQSLAHRVPLSNGNIAVKASSGQSGGGGNKITGGGGSGVLRGSTF